jgi:hypothetical protein
MGRPRANARMCSRCGERWEQSKHGLCRRCEREAGIDVEPSIERERRHVIRLKAEEAARLAAAGRAKYQAPQTYSVVTAGHEFEVINDQLGFGRAFVLRPVLFGDDRRAPDLND